MRDMDEPIANFEKLEDGNNSVACKVRRKIEDHLERRRYKDELGDLGAKLDLEKELIE